MIPAAAGRRSFVPQPTAVPTSPWMTGDICGVALGNLVGFGLIVAGLQATRHSTDPHTLLLLMNLATAGLVVALAANAVFLLSTLRHVGLQRSALLARSPAAAMPAPRAAPRLVHDVLVAGPTMTRYHRASCPAVSNKPVSAATMDEHRDAGRRPCGLCAADQGTPA